MEQDAKQQNLSHKVSTHRDLGGFFEGKMFEICKRRNPQPLKE